MSSWIKRSTRPFDAGRRAFSQAVVVATSIVGIESGEVHQRVER
jgi:hypothetical protein